MKLFIEKFLSETVTLLHFRIKNSMLPVVTNNATVTKCSHPQLSIITASTEYDLEQEQYKTP